MKVGGRDLPLAVRTVKRDDGIERGERDGQIGRMRSDARLRAAEDGVHAVLAIDRRAAAAGIALVARRERQLAEVRAARALHQVAADRRHVAQLRRGAGEQRLRDDREALWRTSGCGATSLMRASAPMRIPPLTRSIAGERQSVDVDEMRRPLDARISSGRRGWCRRR